MRFWHVGLTVKNLDEAIARYENMGLKLTDKFEKEEPRALAALMIGPSGCGVELWQWLNESHPQIQFIRNHVAFISDDPRQDIAKLQESDCEIVIPRTVGKLVNYTFLRDSDGVYIEVAEVKGEYGR